MHMFPAHVSLLVSGCLGAESDLLRLPWREREAG